MKCQPIELLSPARNHSVAVAAIDHGADAVYVGASHHGARAAAGNSVDDISRIVDYAHRFGVRVYATVNTLVYDDEIAQVESLIRALYSVGVDALIVQDMGIMRMDIPPIDLHASTQCDIRTVEKARFLSDVGFSQLVLPREFSLQEIREVSEAVDARIEVFVHGALCVCYSGDCQASYMVNGRSANRGECAQMCRLPYDLIDGHGDIVDHSRHFLSLRDLNRTAYIADLIDAGVSSFKIEGRLKDADYVKNVTAHYRREIDRAIAAAAGRYCRSSLGESQLTFEPRVEKSFNRGFTDYFTVKATASSRMAALDTPKFVGEKVATVVKCHDKRLTVKQEVAINNGDGLGYFDANRRFGGFRANKVEGDVIHTIEPLDLPSGTVLFRNNDRRWADLMVSVTAERKIPVALTLRRVGQSRVAVDIDAGHGRRVSHCREVEMQEAKTPQESTRLRIFTKTGDTVFTVGSLIDEIGEVFIPASVLTALRRDAFALLDSQIRSTHSRAIRLAENPLAVSQSSTLTYHDNVANRLAEEFYRSHGVEHIQRAAEVESPQGEPVVMTCRYCLRRELGACLKEGGALRLAPPLSLRHGQLAFRLEFDCAHCQMKVRLNQAEILESNK